MVEEEYNYVLKSELPRPSLQYTKIKKIPNSFIYKKPDTFQKARNFRYVFRYKKPYTLRYGIFHEIFEVGIYIQKTWHFGLRALFIYKKLDISQKPRQFAICCYMQKSGTLRYALFHWIFEICGGGGYLFILKTMHLFFVAIYKEHNTMRYTLITKKQCTFRYI